MTDFNKAELKRVAKAIMAHEFTHGVWNLLEDKTKRRFYLMAIDAINETREILGERK